MFKVEGLMFKGGFDGCKGKAFLCNYETFSSKKLVLGKKFNFYY